MGTEGEEPARLLVQPGAAEWVRGKARKSFEIILASELPKRRWFDGRARQIQVVRIVDTIPLKKGAPAAAATAAGLAGGVHRGGERIVPAAAGQCLG